MSPLTSPPPTVLIFYQFFDMKIVYKAGHTVDNYSVFQNKLYDFKRHLPAYLLTKKISKKIQKYSLKLRNFFHYENCSICPPSSSTTSLRRVRKLRTTNSKISDGISNITRKISVSNSSKVCGLFLYTQSLRYPCKKKLQTLRSGKFGGQNQPQWNKFGNDWRWHVCQTLCTETANSHWKYAVLLRPARKLLSSNVLDFLTQDKYRFPTAHGNFQR